MPKKRNTYWSRSKKEKQILTARLIEISIKVEDCIYKHKPISICEAEQYMKEVSSYKTLCSRDERSMQVIEKLTRCMKAIISDHQELGSVNHTINNDSPVTDVARAGSLSPVYSIPDEDRTQFTQITEAEPVNIAIANTDVEVIDLCDIDDDDLMHNGTNFTAADHASSRITVEVDIHRAMSSLSLKDGERLEMTSTDVNYSQSILKEFEGVVEVQQNEITCQEVIQDELVGSGTDKSKTSNVMDAAENDLNNTSTHDKTECLAIKPNKKSKTNSASKELIIAANSNNKVNFKTVLQKPLEVANITNHGVTNTYQKDNTVKSQKCYPASNNIPENQTQTWYDSIKTCTINDSSHTLKEANYMNQPMPFVVKNAASLNVNATNTFNKVENGQEPKLIDTSKTFNNPAIVKENLTKKKRGPRKKKDTDETEIKPKNKRVYRAPKSNKEKSVKNKSIPIYNENVINDLSWVENIRFVREIRIDENDRKLNLEDSFWDNYYLPANWSDNEFV